MFRFIAHASKGDVKTSTLSKNKFTRLETEILHLRTQIHDLTLAKNESALQPQQSSASTLLPKGAIVAFKATRCPSGWVAFENGRGRTIIGAGQGNDLKNYALLEQMGKQSHMLSVEELPAHAHTVHGKSQNENATPEDYGPVPYYLYGEYLTTGTVTDKTGGGKAFSLLQPSIALLFCEKQ